MEIRKHNGLYTMVFLGERKLEEDWSDCLITSCTNKYVLSEMSGISRDRLVYVFTKLGRSYLHEKGVLILRSNLLYKGRQKGGLRNPGLTGYNRNR